MKTRLLILPILQLLFFGCTQRPMDRSMGGWGHMMGYGGYGGMFMWLILIIIAGVIIYFAINRSKKPETWKTPHGKALWRF